MTAEIATEKGSGGAWELELRATVKLALPLIAANLGQHAIQLTDVVMMGWLGPDALAAGALAASLYFVLFMIGFGLILAIAPMIAQERGARPHAVRNVRRSVRQGLWVCGLLGAPFSAALWCGDWFMRATGQDPGIVPLSMEYLSWYLFSLVPAMLFMTLRTFLTAMERPRAVTVITTIAIVFNAIADYGLMFGKFGMPELGIRGAGIASILSASFMALALAAFISIDRRLKRYAIFGRAWRADWSQLWELIRLGGPISLFLLLEVGLFSAAMFVTGRFGAATLAAHQVALQFAAVTFMVPMGVAQAATVRVGLAAGRRDGDGVARAGWTALALGTAFMLSMALAMWSFPEALASIFLDPSDAGSAQAFDLAIQFIAVAAVFQIADGAQVVSGGALRGLRDTLWPAVLAFIAYWLVGLTLGVFLAFRGGLGGFGVWIGMASGLAVAALLLTGRFGLRRRFGLVDRLDSKATQSSWL